MMQTFGWLEIPHFLTEIPSAFSHEIRKYVSNNITYHPKAVYAYCDNSFERSFLIQSHAPLLVLAQRISDLCHLLI